METLKHRYSNPPSPQPAPPVGVRGQHRDICPAFLLSLLLGAILTAGCAGNPEAGPPSRSVTDDLGRTVSLPPTVERVVTIAPNLTEIVFVAGAGHKLVGVTTADDYPPAVDSLPHFGALPLDFEAIAALKPNLVLANANINTPRNAETFDALGFPILYYSFEDLDEIFQSVRTIGDLLGTAAHANAAADSLEAAVVALRRTTDQAEDRPLTLFLIDEETLFAFGTESYMHALIDLAGGRSATAELQSMRPILDEEFILTRKPEVIFGAFGEDYDPARLLAFHPTWDIVPAIRDGRVYSLNPDLVLRPTPRLLDGARQMARYLHPALFPTSETPPSTTDTP